MGNPACEPISRDADQTPHSPGAGSSSVHGAALGCDFFEGVVMKRADSIYPVQLRSATEECRGWCKHRFVV
jgi:hypothetical protein